MKINLFFSIILPSIGLVACSNGEAAKTDSLPDSAIADTLDSLTVADTASVVVEEVVEESPIKKLKLTTTEAQINYMNSSPDSSSYRSGILLQMAQDVPEYCQKILENDKDRFIIVDKGKMKVFLYDKFGNVEKSCGIACAKNYGTKRKKGDSRTTEGIFETVGVFDSTNWLFTDDNGYTSPTKGVYGPRFIRLSIPYIGIHGTGSPSSIGKRVSHGCIRVTNDNIMEIVKYVVPGMPVIISPGPRDMAVNQSEHNYVPSVATEPGTPRAQPGKGNYSTTPAKPATPAQEVQNPETVTKVEPDIEDQTKEEHSESSLPAPAETPAPATEGTE